MDKKSTHIIQVAPSFYSSAGDSSAPRVVRNVDQEEALFRRILLLDTCEPVIAGLARNLES